MQAARTSTRMTPSNAMLTQLPLPDLRKSINPGKFSADARSPRVSCVVVGGRVHSTSYYIWCVMIHLLCVGNSARTPAGSWLLAHPESYCQESHRIPTISPQRSDREVRDVPVNVRDHPIEQMELALVCSVLMSDGACDHFLAARNRRETKGSSTAEIHPKFAQKKPVPGSSKVLGLFSHAETVCTIFLAPASFLALATTHGHRGARS